MGLRKKTNLKLLTTLLLLTVFVICSRIDTYASLKSEYEVESINELGELSRKIEQQLVTPYGIHYHTCVANVLIEGRNIRYSLINHCNESILGLGGCQSPFLFVISTSVYSPTGAYIGDGVNRYETVYTAVGVSGVYSVGDYPSGSKVYYTIKTEPDQQYLASNYFIIP